MSFEEVVRLAQQRGFFFKAGESYPNTPAGFWDYGPLGVSLRNKFVELWRRMIVKRDGMIEIDGAQILPRAVFEASGHLSGFTDPIVQCAKCGSVFRPDKLVEEKTGKPIPEKLTDQEYDRMLDEAGVRCQKCGSKLSGTRRFNMMFREGVGAQQEEAYLRPETAQSIFVDFPLLYKTQRMKLPAGVAQVGKVFRNEIAPRQSVIRAREFYQAEVEIFFNPEKIGLAAKFKSLDSKLVSVSLPDGTQGRISVGEAVKGGTISNSLVGYYVALAQSFYEAAGIPSERIRLRKLSDQEKAFYASASYDLEVETSVGWLELVACNYRSDYDLGRHSKVSGSDFTVNDDGEKVLPHVFELSMGVDRSLYAILEASLKVDGERRALMLKPYLAPRDAGVFPLVNKDGLPEIARKIVSGLADGLDVFYDDSGSIGRRYARADEAGVPYCVTVDYQSLKDGSVTVRSRDTRSQERIRMSELSGRLSAMTRYPPIFG